MIICAAIKDTRTGAVFGGIRHGDIYSAMHDAGITPLVQPQLKVFWICITTSMIVMKHLCGRSRLDNYLIPSYIINSRRAKLNCFRRTCTDDQKIY